MEHISNAVAIKDHYQTFSMITCWVQYYFQSEMGLLVIMVAYQLHAGSIQHPAMIVWLYHLTSAELEWCCLWWRGLSRCILANVCVCASHPARSCCTLTKLHFCHKWEGKQTRRTLVQAFPSKYLHAQMEMVEGHLSSRSLLTRAWCS